MFWVNDVSRIEEQVCEKIMKRAEVGFKKYGQTMERTDFSNLKWLEYLQEEMFDAVVYLERIIDDEKKRDSVDYKMELEQFIDTVLEHELPYELSWVYAKKLKKQLEG